MSSSEHSTDLVVSDMVLVDAAYGSRNSLAAYERAGVALGILHKINATAHGK